MDFKNIPIVHTWRDYRFNFEGKTEVDRSAIGAEIVAERLGLKRIWEIRHFMDHTITYEGALYRWIKIPDGGWNHEFFGFTTEEYLRNDY